MDTHPGCTQLHKRQSNTHATQTRSTPQRRQSIDIDRRAESSERAAAIEQAQPQQRQRRAAAEQQARTHTVYRTIIIAALHGRRRGTTTDR